MISHLQLFISEIELVQQTNAILKYFINPLIDWDTFNWGCLEIILFE